MLEEVRNVVVGSDAVIENGVVVGNGAVDGDGVVVENGVVVKNGVVVENGVVVDNGATGDGVVERIDHRRNGVVLKFDVDCVSAQFSWNKRSYTCIQLTFSAIIRRLGIETGTINKCSIRRRKILLN